MTTFEEKILGEMLIGNPDDLLSWKIAKKLYGLSNLKPQFKSMTFRELQGHIYKRIKELKTKKESEIGWH